MFFKIFFLALLSSQLYSINLLKEKYYIFSDEIKLSDIVLDLKTQDFILFKITKGRYSKRVNSKKLIILLKKYGYEDYKIDGNYVKFLKQSIIDSNGIVDEIRKNYGVHYQNIVFKNIEVYSRGYIKSMPTNYSIKIQSKNYLKKDGILSIKDNKTNKQLFFDYQIDALVNVYVTKEKIKRKDELSHKNCTQKQIVLEKFRAFPIQTLPKHSLQIKHQIKKDTIITQRDIQKLRLVRRGSNINVTLRNKNINISFSATAIQNGVYGDIIKVKQSNSKVIKVKVTGFGVGEVY